MEDSGFSKWLPSQSKPELSKILKWESSKDISIKLQYEASFPQLQYNLLPN